MDKRSLPASAWLLAPLLALPWLSPNHYPPWTAFHAELGVACVLLIVAAILLFSEQENTTAPHGFWFVLVLILQVLAGWMLKQIHAGGIAWMSGLYLSGLAGMVYLGANWQSRSDGEALDFLFFALLIASWASSLLEFLQITRYETDSVWFNQAASGFRMDANLAQPNNLASLHLMALIGCSWFALKKKISSFFALLSAFILIAGLALTGSRTGFLSALLVLSIYPWVVGRQVPRWQARLTAAFLVVWCIVAFVFVPQLLVVADIAADGVGVHERGIRGDGRFAIWQVAIDAIGRSPWWGYGWGQVHIGQMMVASEHAALAPFNSAHNIILDLMLWSGIPITLLVLGYGAWRIWEIVRKPMNARQMHAILALAVLLFHSMLELPLHYAYFLLPFGLLWGTLEPVYAAKPMGRRKKALLLLLLISFALSIFVTVKDYLKIERAEKILRLESVRSDFYISDEDRVPNLLLLKQYEDFFLLNRLLPTDGLSPQQLQAMEAAVRAVPSDRLMYNMAANLALNGDQARAEFWLQILCKTRNEVACKQALLNWRQNGYVLQSKILIVIQSER